MDWKTERIANFNYGPQKNTGNYFTQTTRVPGWGPIPVPTAVVVDNSNNVPVDDLNLKASQAQIIKDSAEYDAWADWYKDMLWFDTVGCWNAEDSTSMIGDINDAYWSPTEVWWDGAWWSVKDSARAPNKNGVVDWTTDI